MHFGASGVDTSVLTPFVVAFGVSTLTSMGGVSGAFVLLPFQVSVLGFVGPAVTPTNHLFNVIAIPSGVYRYVREKRMLWPLALIIVVGTMPGVVVGSLARIHLLPDPRNFKLFMGLVLLFIGSRLARKVLFRQPIPANKGRNAATTGASAETPGSAVCANAPLAVRTLRFDWRRLEYEFQGQTYGISTPSLALLTAGIGVIGGAYGVGGGAIIAPFLVSMYRLPVHTIAGSTLLGTCLTSVVGVLFFSVAGPMLGTPNLAPDWLLGALFGAGGLAGMYTGARLQKHVPARAIEAVLAIAVTGLAVSYVIGFFR